MHKMQYRVAAEGVALVAQAAYSESPLQWRRRRKKKPAALARSGLFITLQVY
jgi:hypothetical protein